MLVLVVSCLLFKIFKIFKLSVEKQFLEILKSFKRSVSRFEKISRSVSRFEKISLKMSLVSFQFLVVKQRVVSLMLLFFLEKKKTTDLVFISLVFLKSLKKTVVKSLKKRVSIFFCVLKDQFSVWCFFLEENNKWSVVKEKSWEIFKEKLFFF